MSKQRVRVSVVELINGMFTKAETGAAYRKALYQAKRLTAEEQLLVFDAMFSAAERLDVHKRTGLPNVKPRGSVRVRGRDVVVEVLS